MKINNLQINSRLVFIQFLVFALLLSCEKDDGEQSLIYSMAFTQNLCNGEVVNRDDYFSYGESKLLSEWVRGNGNSSIFEYNSDKKLVKIEEYNNNNNELLYMYLTWDGNKVTRQWYKGDQPSLLKTILEYNSKNELVRLDSYQKIDDEWIVTGYNIYEWQNGNLVRFESYSPPGEETKAQKTGHDLITDYILSKEIFSLEYKEAVNLKNVVYEFVLNYTLVFTYDNANTPFGRHRALSLREPNQILFYASRNNVATYTLVNKVGEAIANFKWEYNDENYPVRRIWEVNNCSFAEHIFNY
jgi:hypothetical protein